MKIEILEDILHERDHYQVGEVRVVDDALGAYFCANGWVKDLEGKVDTAPRDVHRTVKLDLSGAVQKPNVEHIDG